MNEQDPQPAVAEERPVAPCPVCRYDLVNAPAVGPCPSCGTPMNTACINCGYDISATAPQGDCPECGVSVAKSISLTMGEQPARELLRATRFVFWGTIVAYGGMILVGIIVAAVVIGTSVTNPNAPQPFTPHWSSALGALAYSLVLAWAWWMLTKPLPGTPPDTDVPVSRRMVRLLLVLQIGVTIVVMVKPLVMPYVPAPSSAPTQPAGTANVWSALFTPSVIVDIAFGLVAFLLTAAILLFQARYLRFVSARTPGRPGFSLAEVNVWLVPLLATVGIVACGMGQYVASIMLLIHLGILIAGLKRYIAWMEPGDSEA